ncbi:unnamed protein product, partial [Brassica rapa]
LITQSKSKEVKEGTSSQSKVKEGGGCECSTPNGDVIQVCKYKPFHVAKVSLAFNLMNRFGLITEIAEIQELMFLLSDSLLI